MGKCVIALGPPSSGMRQRMHEFRINSGAQIREQNVAQSIPGTITYSSEIIKDEKGDSLRLDIFEVHLQENLEMMEGVQERIVHCMKLGKEAEGTVIAIFGSVDNIPGHLRNIGSCLSAIEGAKEELATSVDAGDAWKRVKEYVVCTNEDTLRKLEIQYGFDDAQFTRYQQSLRVLCIKCKFGGKLTQDNAGIILGGGGERLERVLLNGTLSREDEEEANVVEKEGFYVPIHWDSLSKVQAAGMGFNPGEIRESDPSALERLYAGMFPRYPAAISLHDSAASTEVPVPDEEKFISAFSAGLPKQRRGHDVEAFFKNVLDGV